MGYLTGVKDDFLKITAKYILATGLANSFKTIGVIPSRPRALCLLCIQIQQSFYAQTCSVDMMHCREIILERGTDCGCCCWVVSPSCKQAEKKCLFRVSALSLGTEGSTVNFQRDIDGR